MNIKFQIGDYGIWIYRARFDKKHDGKFIVFQVTNIDVPPGLIVTAIGGDWHDKFPYPQVHLGTSDDCRKLTHKEVIAYVL